MPRSVVSRSPNQARQMRFFTGGGTQLARAGGEDRARDRVGPHHRPPFKPGDGSRCTRPPRRRGTARARTVLALARPTPPSPAAEPIGRSTQPRGRHQAGRVARRREAAPPLRHLARSAFGDRRRAPALAGYDHRRSNAPDQCAARRPAEHLPHGRPAGRSSGVCPSLRLAGHRQPTAQQGGTRGQAPPRQTSGGISSGGDEGGRNA